jgi:hypothetical protein
MEFLRDFRGKFYRIFLCRNFMVFIVIFGGNRVWFGDLQG